MGHLLRTVFCFFALLAVSCGGQYAETAYDIVHYQPEYAGGFDVVGIDGYESHILRVKLPWQGADTTAMELFISRGGEKPPFTFSGKAVEYGCRRVAVMSTSYIGLLAAIGASDCISAVSGLDFVNCPDIVSRKSEIVEIGADSSPDYEGLLASGTDIVLLYGIASASPMEKKLDALGIPYIYIGEYLEPSPLARAEWMVALSEIVGREEDGRAAFRETAVRYSKIRDALSDVSSRPKVMLNVPYGDSWFMASSGGMMANLISDAGGEYVYRENNGNLTVAIGMEKAFILVNEADCWLDTGPFSSMQQLKSAFPALASSKCVADRNVYSPDRRMNDFGGNDFWESAAAMPDVLLHDLALIFHPEEAFICGSESTGLHAGCCNGADVLYFYRRL